MSAPLGTENWWYWEWKFTRQDRRSNLQERKRGMKERYRDVWLATVVSFPYASLLTYLRDAHRDLMGVAVMQRSLGVESGVEDYPARSRTLPTNILWRLRSNAHLHMMAIVTFR